MTTVRCYVPLSPDQLETLRTERRLAGPLAATTVTAAVRGALPTGDAEEWEYAALQEAAAGQAAGGAPVILAAVDLTEDRVDLQDGGEDASVTVGDIDLPRVAALHVGDDVVTGGAAALPSAHEELELSWYDTTEIGHVVELSRALGPRSDPGA
ncbi:DUF6912 family protein [Ornithinimicrobium cerasi]|uniref:DUF6912 family protein n=1 Tax=Ornithinimicrobium cerasi TaxID=2248773 RepID=UPI00137B8AD4|nr:hypothetical protein [Ornithinimicrobium cerasi]